MRLQDKVKFARAAAKESSVWAYRRVYCGGRVTISVRVPSTHTVGLTTLRTWDYAKQAAVTSATARAHLRELVGLHLLSLDDGYPGSALTFRFSREVSELIGTEIITDLVSQGLPFEAATA